MKSWEVIADNLSKAGWSYGYVSAIDSQRGERSGLWTHIADDGKPFLVHADEKLTAFMELESAIRVVTSSNQSESLRRPPFVAAHGLGGVVMAVRDAPSFPACQR